MNNGDLLSNLQSLELVKSQQKLVESKILQKAQTLISHDNKENSGASINYSYDSQTVRGVDDTTTTNIVKPSITDTTTRNLSKQN